MTVIYVLIPLAVVMAAVAIGAFLLSVRRGQLDDLDTPQLRILHEE